MDTKERVQQIISLWKLDGLEIRGSLWESYCENFPPNTPKESLSNEEYEMYHDASHSLELTATINGTTDFDSYCVQLLASLRSNLKKISLQERQMVIDTIHFKFGEDLEIDDQHISCMITDDTRKGKKIKEALPGMINYAPKPDLTNVVESYKRYLQKVIKTLNLETAFENTPNNSFIPVNGFTPKYPRTGLSYKGFYNKLLLEKYIDAHPQGKDVFSSLFNGGQITEPINWIGTFSHLRYILESFRVFAIDESAKSLKDKALKIFKLKNKDIDPDKYSDAGKENGRPGESKIPKIEECLGTLITDAEGVNTTPDFEK